jgi:hypothetical protein
MLVWVIQFIRRLNKSANNQSDDVRCAVSVVLLLTVTGRVDIIWKGSHFVATSWRPDEHSLKSTGIGRGDIITQTLLHDSKVKDRKGGYNLPVGGLLIGGHLFYNSNENFVSCSWPTKLQNTSVADRACCAFTKLGSVWCILCGKTFRCKHRRTLRHLPLAPPFLTLGW